MIVCSRKLATDELQRMNFAVAFLSCRQPLPKTLCPLLTCTDPYIQVPVKHAFKRAGHNS